MTMNNQFFNRQNPQAAGAIAMPSALNNMLSNNRAVNPGYGAPTGQLPPQAAGLASNMIGGPTTFIPTPPSYQAGGMIGPGGMPAAPPTGVGVNPNGQAGQPMDYQMMEMNINQFASQHPQQLKQIQDVIMQLMQSGELTQEQLNMVTQLATVAAQNPEMYPYVRQFAIQQGIATEQDLPQQYDQGLVFVLLLAARAAQQAMGGQNMMQGGSPAMAGGQPVPSMAVGGKVPQSRKEDGSVLINAHEGEYVIPKNVVEMKGREFFDSLVEKYKG
jgi:hypothetical protein